MAAFKTCSLHYLLLYPLSARQSRGGAHVVEFTSSACCVASLVWPDNKGSTVCGSNNCPVSRVDRSSISSSVAPVFLLAAAVREDSDNTVCAFRGPANVPKNRPRNLAQYFGSVPRCAAGTVGVKIPSRFKSLSNQSMLSPSHQRPLCQQCHRCTRGARTVTLQGSGGHAALAASLTRPQIDHYPSVRGAARKSILAVQCLICTRSAE